MNTIDDFMAWDYPTYETLRVRKYDDDNKLRKYEGNEEVKTPEDVSLLPPGRYRVELLKAGKPVRNGTKSVTIAALPASLRDGSDHAFIDGVYRSASSAAAQMHRHTLSFAEKIVSSFPKALAAMTQSLIIAQDNANDWRKKYTEEQELRVSAEQSSDSHKETMEVLSKFADVLGVKDVTPEKVAEVFRKIPENKRRDALTKLYEVMDPEVRVQCTLIFVVMAMDNDADYLRQLVLDNPTVSTKVLELFAPAS